MNRKGFTLVELLGAVTILAIIMGLAIISYSSINKKVDDNCFKFIKEDGTEDIYCSQNTEVNKT